jgi:hypothetical protein
LSAIDGSLRKKMRDSSVRLPLNFRANLHAGFIYFSLSSARLPTLERKLGWESRPSLSRANFQVAFGPLALVPAPYRLGTGVASVLAFARESVFDPRLG